MFLIGFPLLLIPFALYNMIAFLLDMTFDDTLFAIPLFGHRSMPVTTGDFLVGVGMLMLYVEMLKASRFGSKVMMDHVLSAGLFAAMVLELLTTPKAATSIFLMLLGLGFIDVIGGLSLGSRRGDRVVLVDDPDGIAAS